MVILFELLEAEEGFQRGAILTSEVDAVDGSSRRVSAMDVGAVEAPTIRRSQIMQAITTITAVPPIATEFCA